MKDSQRESMVSTRPIKYIKANNEIFSTVPIVMMVKSLSISRRIMKDSQRSFAPSVPAIKYIKANNERFSTTDFDSAQRS